MTGGLVFTAASVLVAATPQANPLGSVSITVTAKALGRIELLIADCAEIDLAPAAGSEARSYEMATRPVRLDTLTGEPTVVVRAIGIADAAALTLGIRLEASQRVGDIAVVLNHDFGNVDLTAGSPVAVMRLPLGDLRADR
jgi:hypothetical protein